MKKLVTLLLSAMFLFGLTTFAFAAESGAVNSRESVKEKIYDDKNPLLEQRFKVISDYFNTLDSTRAKALAHKKRISKLEQELLSIKEGTTNNLAKEKETAEKEYQKLLSKIEDLELNAEKLSGLTKLTGDRVSVKSEVDDISIDPDLWYDSYADHYVMHGDYYWINNNWKGDELGDGYVGGKDGFEIFVDEDIDRYDEAFSLWDSEGNSVNIAAAHDSDFGDPEGDDWLWQDKIYQTWDNYLHRYVETYNSDYGAGIVYFEFEDSVYGEDVEVGCGYAHTWDNTSITSISVGLGSGGISWDNKNDQWYEEDVDVEHL